MFQVDKKKPNTVNGLETNETAKVNQEPNQDSNLNTTNNANKESSLFGSILFNNPFTSQSSTTLKEYIDKLKELDTDQRLIFVPVDKEIYSGIEYSVIAVCSMDRRSDVDKVYYYTILLTSTGRGALTAEEFVKNELNARQANVPNYENYTYTDAMNVNLDAAVRAAIKNKLGEVKCYNCDGIVYKGGINDGLQRLLYLSINAIELAKLESKTGLNLPEITRAIQGKGRYYFNVTSTQGDYFDEMGNIKTSTFIAEIGIESTNLNPINKELNNKKIDTVLAQIAGFIMPQPVTTDVAINGIITKTQTIAPNIVITDVYTRVPDSSSNVLAIAAAAMMAHKNNWVKVLVDSAEKLKLGSLNYLLKKYPDEKLQYNEFNFSDLTPEEKALTISELFQGAPNISFDITPNQYNNNLNFLTYAENKPSNEREAKYIEGSNKDFEKGIELLLGEKTEYNGSKIISKITIPYGYVTTKKGEHGDIRNITLSTILSETKGQDETVYRSYMGMLSPNNPNAFNNYIDIIYHFYRTALIEGKTTRVTFDNRFLNFLVSKVIGCTQGIENKNSFVMPQTVNYDYTAFNQQQVNIAGLNQNIFNNNMFNYNSFNTAYGAGRYY